MKIYQSLRKFRKYILFLRTVNSFLNKNGIKVERKVLSECYKTLIKKDPLLLPAQYIMVEFTISMTTNNPNSYRVLISHEIDFNNPSHLLWVVHILIEGSILKTKDRLSFTV